MQSVYRRGPECGLRLYKDSVSPGLSTLLGYDVEPCLDTVLKGAEGQFSFPSCLILGFYHLGARERHVYMALHLFQIIHQCWRVIVPC